MTEEQAVQAIGALRNIGLYIAIVGLVIAAGIVASALRRR